MAREGAKGPTMIRKVKSGEYRLYSRKTDPKTGKRRNLGTFKSRAAAESTRRVLRRAHYFPVYATRQTVLPASSAINRLPSFATSNPAGRPYTWAGLVLPS